MVVARELSERATTQSRMGPKENARISLLAYEESEIWAQGARAGDPLLVCEPQNAGLPPKKHLRDLTHRERVALFFLIVSKDRAVDATRLSLAARSLMNTARCADHRAVAIPERCTARQC